MISLSIIYPNLQFDQSYIYVNSNGFIKLWPSSNLALNPHFKTSSRNYQIENIIDIFSYIESRMNITFQQQQYYYTLKSSTQLNSYNDAIQLLQSIIEFLKQSYINHLQLPINQKQLYIQSIKQSIHQSNSQNHNSIQFTSKKSSNLYKNLHLNDSSTNVTDPKITQNYYKTQPKNQFNGLEITSNNSKRNTNNYNSNSSNFSLNGQKKCLYSFFSPSKLPLYNDKLKNIKKEGKKTINKYHQKHSKPSKNCSQKNGIIKPQQNKFDKDIMIEHRLTENKRKSLIRKQSKQSNHKNISSHKNQNSKSIKINEEYSSKISTRYDTPMSRRARILSENSKSIQKSKDNYYIKNLKFVPIETEIKGQEKIHYYLSPKKITHYNNQANQIYKHQLNNCRHQFKFCESKPNISQTVQYQNPNNPQTINWQSNIVVRPQRFVNDVQDSYKSAKKLPIKMHQKEKNQYEINQDTKKPNQINIFKHNGHKIQLSAKKRLHFKQIDKSQHKIPIAGQPLRVNFQGANQLKVNEKQTKLNQWNYTRNHIMMPKIIFNN